MSTDRQQLDLDERDRAEREQRRVNFEGWKAWHEQLLTALSQPVRKKPASTNSPSPGAPRP